MAEAIAIPSPSVFLRPDSPNPADKPASAHDSNAPRQAKAAKSGPRKDSGTGNDGQATKKTTPRKSNSIVNGDGNAAVKPKQTKSRNGCVTCKVKRLKCDEAKPGCKQCEKRKVECGGYRKEFKWFPFEETNVKQMVERQKQASSPPRPLSAEHSKAVTPTDERAAKVPTLSSPQECPPSLDESRPSDHQPLTPGQQIDLVQRSKPPPPPPPPSRRPNPPSRAVTAPPPPTPAIPAPRTPEDERRPASATNGGVEKPPSKDDQLLDLPMSSGPGTSPTLTEILMPFHDVMDQLGDIDDIDLPEDLRLPFAEFPMFADQAVDDNPMMPVPGRSADEVQQIWASRYDSPSTSSTSTLDERMTLMQLPSNFLFHQPGFDVDSEEMLALRFDRFTCGILSIMDGPTENPWRTLIWPLAKESLALRHAIFAMTAYHSSGDVKALRSVGHYHKSMSISNIREGIQYGNMADEAAIATTLALGFSESWDQHTVTGNFHIKGAQALVKRAIARHQRKPLQGSDLACLKFLCNAWVYMDVIARLTSVDSDDSEDFDSLYLFSPESPGIITGGPDNGFGIDFGMPVDARLDPLMGCANTLFPIIGRVANVVRRVCRTLNNSPSIIEQATELKLALETWDPPEFIEPPEDPTAQLQHALQTAEAYRWATLLHLQQSVPELPSPSDEELSREVLNRLATVPLASRLVIVQIYPLMVGGALADNDEDRNWVRKRWQAMAQRMRIGILDKCAMVTEEVWRRRDVYRSTPQEHRKVIRTSDLHPIRRSGAPLKRSREEDNNNIDAGRSGVVYSWINEPEGHGGRPNNNNNSNSNSNANNSNNNNHNRQPSGSAGAPVRRPGNKESYVPYSVRGHLHWVGVMWDWGWEILLG